MNTEVFCNYTCIYYRYAHGEVKLTTSSSGPHSFLIYDLGLYFGLDNFYIKKKIRLRAMISDPWLIKDMALNFISLCLSFWIYKVEAITLVPTQDCSEDDIYVKSEISAWCVIKCSARIVFISSLFLHSSQAVVLFPPMLHFLLSLEME